MKDRPKIKMKKRKGIEESKEDLHGFHSLPSMPILLGHYRQV